MRLVYIAFAWTAGILLASNGVSLPSVWWAGMALAMVIIVGFAWNDSTYRLINIALLAFALGGLRHSFTPDTSGVAAYNNAEGVQIQGVVIDDPDVRDDRIQFRLRAESIFVGSQTHETDGLVLVRAPRVTDVAYGDHIAVSGKLFTPAEFDTFSYSDFLARQGVYSIMENTIIEPISKQDGFSFYATVFDLRRTVNEKIADDLPEPQAGLLTGILTGNQRGISPELADDFGAVGASHIIAISGFNMAIIAGVVTGILRRLSLNRKLEVVFGIAILVAYTIFAGANAAVIRAAIMSSLLIVGDSLRRKTYVPASLAFVAIFMSALNPTVLWDLSFQLSFFATLGLALYTEPFTNAFNGALYWAFPQTFATRISNFLLEPVIVTLAALVFTLPLIIVYFGRISLLVLPVNILVVPIQAPLLLVGGLATIVSFIVPPLGQALFWLDYVALTWTIEVIRAFARFTFAETTVFVDPRLITLYFVILIGWSLMHATQPRWWLAFVGFVRSQLVVVSMSLSGAAIIILMASVYFSRPDDQLHVWFLDVGHSNAVLIETPGGSQILVDGGRFPSRLLTSIGDRLPFTDREIELMIITQPNEFNYAAATSVLDRYDIGVALTNGQPNLSDSFVELESKLAVHDVVVARAGYTVEFDDGAQLEVLHPQTLPTLGDSINDNALVLRLSYGDVSFLLTSDLSAEAQIELIEAGNYPLATVLQLPQHGTARSLERDFIAAVQPQAVVVQADRANRRGDPDEAILAMLDKDTPVFRTDEDGVVHLWTNGESLWGETEN